MTAFLGILSLIIGTIFVFVAAIGMWRMPDIFIRMSTTTKAATIGVGFMLLGATLFFGDLGTAGRSLVIFAFILATAPVSAHMIGRAAYAKGVPLWEGTVIDELREVYSAEQKDIVD